MRTAEQWAALRESDHAAWLQAVLDDKTEKAATANHSRVNDLPAPPEQTPPQPQENAAEPTTPQPQPMNLELRALLDATHVRELTNAENSRMLDLAHRAGWKPSPEVSGIIRATGKALQIRDVKIKALEVRVAELESKIVALNANIRRNYDGSIQ